MEWLEPVAKDHKKWVEIVEGFGERYLAEDIVQEMYLRLWLYADENKVIKEGKVNTSFVYMVLRNTFYIYKKHNADGKQTKKLDKVTIGKGFDIKEETDNTNEGYALFLERLDNELNSWHWFDKVLFELYVNKEMSIREIAKQTKIGTSSIFNTLKNCKLRIKENLGEDWEDFINEDYEKI